MNRARLQVLPLPDGRCVLVFDSMPPIGFSWRWWLEWRLVRRWLRRHAGAAAVLRFAYPVDVKHRDQWRSRALEAEDKIDGQAWEDLERDRDRLRTELDRAESTIAAWEDPEVRAALESETTGDFGSVPDPRSAPGAPPWDIARLCGDSTGPNGVGGPCVLPPGHPHVDGIGGMWPAAPGAPTPAAQGVLAAACAYADSAAAPTDTPHEDALLDAVAAYRAAGPQNPALVGAEAQGVLWMALRYALGRATYAPAEVLGAIRAHAHRLPGWQRQRMADEIDRAIGTDAAGMGCDVAVWRRVAAALRAAGPADCHAGGAS